MLSDYREVVVLDFEFDQPDGELPYVVCMVAVELNSGHVHSLWRDELVCLSRPPFDIGRDVLVVTFFGSAEMSCFIELGWDRPINLLDLYVEDRAVTNGVLERRKGLHSLIGACTRRGVRVMRGADKEEARSLIIGRRSWSPTEQRDILFYCRADVDATTRLLLAMERDGEIDWGAALLRGRYSGMAVAKMQAAGVPIDTALLGELVDGWDAIKRHLIHEIDADYQVYDDTTFKTARFAAYLQRHRIAWPLTETGRLSFEDLTFRDMAKRYPQLMPLRELRATLSDMRLTKLQVGSDGRNRALLSQFGAATSRNTPSATGFIFGPAVWIRGLIKPPPGYGLAYCDWHAQEISVAASIYGDERMMRAYQTGGGDEMLAGRLGIPLGEAVRLKELHQETYRDFWRNSDRFVASAYACGRMWSVFGWPIRVRPDDRPQAILNYPIQSSGADMMRLAAIAATEAGIEVVAPVHDAFLIMAPLDCLEDRITQMQAIMQRAGEAVTGGFPVWAGAKRIRWPERYADPRGAVMWATAMRLLPEIRENSMVYPGGYGGQRGYGGYDAQGG